MKRTDHTITSEPLKPISTMPTMLFVIILSAVGVAVVAVYLGVSAGLLEAVDLKSYQPKIVSVFYAEDGSVLSLFYKERRFPVALDSVPKPVQRAFVAAEDARFFKHSGIDPWGIVRALFQDLRKRNFAQGGSTITQQVARSIFLTKEKTISRKLREMILALRIEHSNSKAQILETYLNDIYLGRGAYGIEAAAQAYFGKKTSELTIGEAAYIAGLASSPSLSTPENAEKAQDRRDYVLNAMLKSNYITAGEFKRASEEKLAFVPNAPDQRGKGFHFTEVVRRYVISKYGEKALYEEGLQVWTTADKSLQAKAEEAVIRGVKAWEARQGRPAGLLKRLNSAEIQDLKSSPRDTNMNPGTFVQGVILSTKEISTRSRPSLHTYELTVMTKGGDVYQVQAESERPYRKNDLVGFKVVKIESGKPILEHNPLPPVQGALVSIENNTGYVRALVGGASGDKAGFDRASQAFRQPGSAFKPIVYSAALEWGHYDPRTIIVDEPIAVRMTSNQPEWIPENPDGRFQGPLDLKTALVKSRNIPAVKIMMDLGPKAVAQMAAQMGIKSPIKDNLSSALGASEVSPLDLTSAYTVFPNMGVKVTPVLIKKISDRAGNVLEENTVTPLNVVERARKDIRNGVCVAAPKSLQSKQRQADPLEGSHGEVTPVCGTFEVGGPNMVRVLSPQTAYLMLSILREVTVSGTASQVSKMLRTDLAGKTGSTNDYTDAWFIGFNPKYTTGVWIGYDTRDSLGNKEFGAKAALPVWMEYMSYALRNDKPKDWPAPPGIESAGSPYLTWRSYGRSGTRSAHFAPGRQLKQVSPVDLISFPFSAGLDAYAQWFGPAIAGALSNSGLIRVLSPKGKTLGLAVYTQDEKGNPVLREVFPPGFDQSSPSPD